MPFFKRKILLKTFIESQFSYCPLIWMFHNRKLNRTRSRTGLKNHTGHINMQTVLLDEKLREKKYGISSQPISPQQTDWLIVYGPLTSCNNKKIRKIYNIVPRASYIFDVGVPCYYPSNERSYKNR